MTINKELEIQGSNIRITEALKEYINKKFIKAQRSFNLVQSARINLEYSKNLHTVEVVIGTFLDRSICMKTSSEDMYASIDIAFSRVTRKLRKVKEKTIDLKRYRLLESKRKMIASI